MSNHIFDNVLRQFLRNLHFSNVPADNEDFILGNQEIDAFGYHEGIYVIIDAKTSETDTGHSTGYLQRIVGYKKDVIEDINRLYAQHESRLFLFIYWTKGKNLTPENYDYARDNEIYYRDNFDLEIYNESLTILENKEMVRNTFFSDLSKQIDGTEAQFSYGESQVKAIETKKGDKIFYTFQIPIEKLLKYCYVFRVGTNTYLESYQRLLNKKKIEKLRGYIQSGGYFANNIIVAYDGTPIFDCQEPSTEIIRQGHLHLPDKPCFLEIIDGQHRLMAFSNLNAFSRNCLPVTAITNLNKIDRVKLFITVNKEQTKVNPDLLWDLTEQINPDSIDGKIAAFVKKINDSSPLRKLINLPRVRSETSYLSYSNFCLTLQNRTKLYKDYETHETQLLHTINTYYRVLLETYREDWDRCKNNKGSKGFIITNNAISVHLKLLKSILKERERLGVQLPNSSQQLEWRDFLIQNMIPAFSDYLEESKSGETDPYGILRSSLTNEGARSKAARSVFENISFS